MKRGKNFKDAHEFTEFDGYLFGNGTNYEAYRKLGAHPCVKNGVEGTWFAVWAPHARSVKVLVSSYDYLPQKGIMHRAAGNVGVWEVFLPEVKAGSIYRFAVEGCDGVVRYKSDPFAFQAELRPANASIVCADSSFCWSDASFLEKKTFDPSTDPMAIYEVHLGSWKKDYRLNSDGFLNYREIAGQLAEYVNYMGYTHVELVGICEHPFDGSWGYQCSGFFAPTSRHGSPDDFRFFVDTMHRAGIGVILDWVPAHFPKDSFCMGLFDGTHLYEYEDPLRMEMPGWGTYAFDHGKNQVKSFLISSAFYWIREFHVDGLRIDAVAAMLMNNFERGEYRPNKYGGVENLEGCDFLKQLNEAVSSQTRGFTIAEDSTITKDVTGPVEAGGLGFSLKWSLGWMNDTLRYFKEDPLYRKYLHDVIVHTFSYAMEENFVLVLSHDEVVHLKHSMLEKMPGSPQEKFAGLKALFAMQYASPGKKLLFMGQEFAEDREWDESRQIGWEYAENGMHRDVMMCVRKLNHIYMEYSCLFSDSKNRTCFEWVANDRNRNIFVFIRRNPWNYDGAVLVAANLSPVEINGFCCGVPISGYYKKIFSTYPDNGGDIPPMTACRELCDGREYKISYNLRPNEVIYVSFPLSAQECEKKEETKKTKK